MREWMNKEQIQLITESNFILCFLIGWEELIGVHYLSYILYVILIPI